MLVNGFWLPHDGYVIENRPGFPGYNVKITEETPEEAEERRAFREWHRAELFASFELGDRLAEECGGYPESKP